VKSGVPISPDGWMEISCDRHSRYFGQRQLPERHLSVVSQQVAALLSEIMMTHDFCEDSMSISACLPIYHSVIALFYISNL
jgi:hypothetical protein